MSRRVPATIVNHVAIDIAADADSAWQVILGEIVEGRSFRAQNAMTPLDDPNVPLGGFRTKVENGAGGIDEHVIQVTERDEAARRASVRADYVSDPNGTLVYATYEAREIPGGVRFSIDSHTSLELDVPDGADVGSIIARDTAHNQTEMTARLEKVKARLEGAE